MDGFTREGLHFDVDDRGSGPEAVIALHGFPADRHCWDATAERLVDAGLRVLAPDQRGYSPGARPTGRRAYAVAELAADVLALADQAGLDRFHVVGHDWGAAVAWHLAGTQAERVATLAAVSVPHPRAFAASLLRSSQAWHSWYMLALQLPALPERQLARQGGRWFARNLEATGLPPEVAGRYAARATNPGAMTGPINWYRALPAGARTPTGTVSVPTVMVWSPSDPFCVRAGVEATPRFVRGPYRLVELPGAGHWIPEVAPDPLADAVVELTAAHPASG